MRGAISAAVAAMTYNLFARSNKGPERKITSLKGWRISEPSPYFGKRKKPVLAILKDGSKKLMALKNASKKNLDFTTI